MELIEDLIGGILLTCAYLGGVALVILVCLAFLGIVSW